MRLSGLLFAIRQALPQTANCRVTYLDGDGELGPSFEAVRRHLRSSRSCRVLVGAINDPSALGVLGAFHEAGRAKNWPSWGRTRHRKEERNCASQKLDLLAQLPISPNDTERT